MALDVLLVCVTLVVAVIGTLLRDPSKPVKIFLIGLAIVSSLASVLKAVSDASEKDFMKAALISSLIPSSTVYKELVDAIHQEDVKRGFEKENCYHDNDGMVCFVFSPKESTRNATLVFDRSDVAELYAHHLQRKSNAELVGLAFSKPYEPKDLQDDFSNKVGLLGKAVFFNIFGRSADYAYDDSFGVKIDFSQNGVARDVRITSDELKALPPEDSSELFYKLEQMFRQRFQSYLSQSQSGTLK